MNNFLRFDHEVEALIALLFDCLQNFGLNAQGLIREELLDFLFLYASIFLIECWVSKAFFIASS